MSKSAYKDFVKTYNRLSAIIQGLIDNNDMDEKTNRRYIVGYIMQELAKKGLLKETLNEIDFKQIFWNVDHRCGIKMKDFDGQKVAWEYLD